MYTKITMLRLKQNVTLSIHSGSTWRHYTVLFLVSEVQQLQSILLISQQILSEYFANKGKQEMYHAYHNWKG